MKPLYDFPIECGGIIDDDRVNSRLKIQLIRRDNETFFEAADLIALVIQFGKV